MIEQNHGPAHLSVFTNHFLSKPVENKALLHTLFIEKRWSARQISDFTGWPKTTITEAIETLGLQRSPNPILKDRFGWKVQDGKLVPHIRQQKIIQKILNLRNTENCSYTKITKFLNDNCIPTLKNKRWDHKIVRTIIEREKADYIN